MYKISAQLLQTTIDIINNSAHPSVPVKNINQHLAHLQQLELIEEKNVESEEGEKSES